MKQSIQLQIPTPCHENWHQMTPVEQGRFCNACAKTVIDFSIMTDQQILDYLSTASAGVCGRVNDAQLSRTLAPVPVPPKTKWWMVFVMPLLIGINRVAAQKKQSLTGKVAVAQPAPACKVGELAAPVQAKQMEITGKVTDGNGAVIPYALVTVDATGTTVSANSEGRYALRIRATGDSVKLSAKSLGYITRQYTFTAKAVTNLDIELQPEAADLAPVIVKGYYSRHRICYTGGAVAIVKSDTLLTAIKDTINRFAHFVTGKPQRFSVAPNPVRRHQQFTLLSQESDTYTIQVLNNSGIVVFVQYYKEAKGVSQHITAQSAWIPGMYYVRMIDEKTKQQYTQKIVVM